MTELQEARAKWLDAESRCLELQSQNARWIAENHELRAKLLASQCQATVMEEMARGCARALLTV